jgi:uncharacterized 2Fe-2S/4Fe-4S cluster protein (DUF4445 family)
MEASVPIRLFIEPGARRIEVERGARLAHALERAGVEFAYPCAASQICGQCRVQFEKGAPPPTPEETGLLSYAEIASGTRLACCTVLTEDARVRLPVSEILPTEHILNRGVKSDILVDPEVRKYRCVLPPSTLAEPVSDWRRVIHSLPEKVRAEARPTLDVLRKLPDSVACSHARNEPVTLTMRLNRVIEVECGDHMAEHAGVAVDLGTTTIAAALVDMNTGAELAVAGCRNPQRDFGADLISRIHAVQTDPENLDALHSRAIEAISGLIAGMCRERSIAPETICAMSLAGNTVMSHLFLRIDPRGLGQAPFAGVLRAGVRLEGRDLGLPIHPHAPVYVLPCMGGFVGGDIVAGILMTKLEQQPGISVLVDIGTNGEVVVARDGKLHTTSSAAGPAFEGGKIACGMIARDGAINAVRFDGTDFQFSTLGGAPPLGLCGSGLIEAFARGLATGMIQMNGRMIQPGATATLPPALSARLRTEGENGLRILLTSAENGAAETWISQADVREFQLSKGAIQAAIAMILREENIALDQIDRFLVAGAFGNNLNTEDAIALGILPDLPRERIFFIGNSSLEGARCVLLNRYERQRAERIAAEARLVELASRPEFQERFAMAMMLAPASLAE